MTQEQKDVIDKTLACVRVVNDVLEMYEIRLRKFGDVKADPSDPYGIDVDDVADEIELIRRSLMDEAVGLLGVFSRATIEEGK